MANVFDELKASTEDTCQKVDALVDLIRMNPGMTRVALLTLSHTNPEFCEQLVAYFTEFAKPFNSTEAFGDDS